MPRMNIKRTCKNRFLRCPTSGNSLKLWVWPHVGERAKCQKIGVCHATFGHGRPPRSVGPLGLAAEIVSGRELPYPRPQTPSGKSHTIYTRDTLFSYYDCSQPLFGKAAEAAINMSKNIFTFRSFLDPSVPSDVTRNL